MSKIKRYLDCYIPITVCNLRCSYCYIAQKKLFDAKPFKLSHSLDEMEKAFDIERLGGTCLVNLCAGGETLLYPEIKELVERILGKGHYVMIVTNGLLTQQIEKLMTIPFELRKKIFFKFSYHYLELKRLDKFEMFFANVNYVKSMGCAFTIELTPCDEEIPFIDDIKKRCIENVGAPCHVTIARSDIDPEQRIPHLSELSFEEFVNTWSVFDSPLLKEKSKFFYEKRREFCYAGEWAAYISLETGAINQCYCGKVIGNFYDFSKPIKWEAIGKGCTLAHCYNGHSWLSLGCIPEFEIADYATLRNRICPDGTEWLNETIKEAFLGKLKETNQEYSMIKKVTLEYVNKLKLLYGKLKSGNK